MVDNFEDSNGYCFCSLFPTIFINCSFKILEISVKTQLPDFRLFCCFFVVLKKYLPFCRLQKIKFDLAAGIIKIGDILYPLLPHLFKYPVAYKLNFRVSNTKKNHLAIAQVNLNE